MTVRQPIFNARILRDSVTKLNPLYLAKSSPVMFTVEVGFFLLLGIGLLQNPSSDFVNENSVFYFESAIILIVTVWFATFSESLSELRQGQRSIPYEALRRKLWQKSWSMETRL